jgi:hypothetical protein
VIHYHLLCGAGHQFDGWFNSSAGFEAQAERGLLSCPHCTDTKIVRALMAPNLRRSAEGRGGNPVPDIPDNLRACLQKLRAKIESECDYVGADFTAESRRMHRGETTRRPIYGESTEEERQELKDENIHIHCIPWIERSDS